MTARVAIFNDTRSDQDHFGCALVMDRLEALIQAAGAEIVARWPVGKDWRDAKGELPKTSEIDAIVVNGEGTMHGAPKNKRAVALAELGAFSKRHYGVPTILINATFHNNDDTFYEALKHFDSIWLRDTQSCAIAREFGLAAHYCPDLTFSQNLTSTAPARAGIGVTGSVRYHDDQMLCKFAHATNSEFVSMVEKSKASRSSYLSLSVGDIRRTWRSRKRNTGINWQLRPHTTLDFIEFIRRKSLVVTGRYHTVSLCILTQTPFLFVESNTPKITALCEDAGLRGDRCIQNLHTLFDKNAPSIIKTASFSNNEEQALLNFASNNSVRFEELSGAFSELFSTDTNRVFVQ